MSPRATGNPQPHDFSDEIRRRFWERVDRRDMTSCWEWTGAKMAAGYGGLSGLYAHRLSYELNIGPIPEGLMIDHLCNNRRCVNPKHLRACTNAENVGRARRERTHCRRGHLQEGENVRMERRRHWSNPNEWNLYRRCLACRPVEKALREARSA